MSLSNEITLALYSRYLTTSEILIPRYTPREWWECDLWRLTRAGYVDEFEIKISLADYRADTKKGRRDGVVFDSTVRRYEPRPAVLKHELLATSTGGPNRFWFVTTPEVASKVEPPEYAGMLVYEGGYMFVDRNAPQRHSRKWDGCRTRLLRCLHGRYWIHEERHRGKEPLKYEQ